MSDLIEAIAKALGPYPLIQIVAVLTFGSLGAFAWWRGERDRKSAAAPQPSGTPVQVPLFLLIDPVRSVFDAVHNISEATRQTNERNEQMLQLLQQQQQEHRAHREILERIERRLEHRRSS